MLEAEASRTAQAPAETPNTFTLGHVERMETIYANVADRISTGSDEVSGPGNGLNNPGVEKQVPAVVRARPRALSRQVPVQPPSHALAFGWQDTKALSESAPRCVKTERIRLIHQEGLCCRATYSKHATNSVITRRGVYYPPLQSKTGLPREVYMWLQSLDLSVEYSNIRRDLSNGYLVAEIFSRYFVEANMRLVTNGTSLIRKMNNWFHLDKFFKRKQLKIQKDLIEGTIHRWPGAAELLILQIYNLVTNRTAKIIIDDEVDFMDSSYQDKLPDVAKSTAAHAIRSNIRNSEIALQPDQFKVKQKILGIINVHMQRKQTDKMTKSKRLHKKPTLGELAVRLTLPGRQYEEMAAKNGEKSETSLGIENHISDIQSKTSVQFKEVIVKQLVRNSKPNKMQDTFHV